MSLTDKMIRGGIAAVSDFRVYSEDIRAAGVSEDQYRLVRQRSIWRNIHISTARQSMEAMLSLSYELSGIAQVEILAEHLAAFIALVVHPNNWQLATKILSRPLDGTKLIQNQGSQVEAVAYIPPTTLLSLVFLASQQVQLNVAIPMEQPEPQVVELATIKGTAEEESNG